MKSKFFVGLMVLALSACGGSSSGGGLIKGGEEYDAEKEQEVQNVPEAVKREKAESVKGVTINEKSTINYSMKASYEGQSYSMSMKVVDESKYVLNFEQESISLTMKATANINGQSSTEKSTTEAKRQNGEWVLVSGNEGSAFDASDLGMIYEGYCETIYSWNYFPAEADFDDLFGQLDQTGVDLDVQKIMEEIYSSFVISGDPASGTFQVGLGKSINFQEAIGYPAVVDSLSTSFKDYLAQSMSMKMHMNMSESGSSIKMNVSTAQSFSYSR